MSEYSEQSSSDKLIPGNLSILHVEDDESVRESLVRFLQRRFHRVYSGVNGQDGLDLFLKHTPDIVVTDIQMPVMDGLKMAEEIRKYSPYQPIVITTAYSEIPYMSRAESLGIQRYLRKPIMKKDFLASLYEISLTLTRYDAANAISSREILDRITDIALFGNGGKILHMNKRAEEMFCDRTAPGFNPEDLHPDDIFFDGKMPGKWEGVVEILRKSGSGDPGHHCIGVKTTEGASKEVFYPRLSFCGRTGNFTLVFAQDKPFDFSMPAGLL